MSCHSDKASDEAATCLQQLRLQLQHMRPSNSYQTINSCNFKKEEQEKDKKQEVSVNDSVKFALSSFIPPRTQNYSHMISQNDLEDREMYMLQQLEIRIREYQASGAKKRGELVYAVGKAESDLEQLQYFSEKCQLDIKTKMQKLELLLKKEKEEIENILLRPEIIIKEVMTSQQDEDFYKFNKINEEKEDKLISQLQKMQKKLDSLKIKIQKDSSTFSCHSNNNNNNNNYTKDILIEFHSERKRAEAQLLSLKTNFVNVVKDILDELEELRRERLETEAQCASLLN